MNHQIKTICDKKAVRILLILGIWLFNIAFVIGYMMNMQQAGNLLGVSTASSHMPDILIQNIIETAPMLAAMVLSFLLLKGQSLEKLGLSVTNKKQWIAIIVLAVLMFGMAVAANCMHILDAGTIFYQLFYYFIIIAFFEEFEYRCLFPALLKDKFSNKWVYIFPNLLFGLCHLFSFNGFFITSFGQILQFLTSDVLGLFVAGCIFQFIKEKTGTVWIAVLIHAIYDYSGIFL